MKRFILTLIFWSYATSVLAAVGIGAIASTTSTAYDDTNLNLDAGSGSNRGVIVGISVNNGSFDYLSAPCHAEYAGAAMTEIASAQHSNYGSMGLHYWIKIGPASGVNTIHVFCDDGNDRSVVGIALTGVDQTTPTGAATTDTNGADGFPTVGVSSASVDEIVFAIVAMNNGIDGSQQGWTACAPGTSETERHETAVNYARGCSYTKAGAAGTVTIAPTLTESDQGIGYHMISGVAIKAAAAAGVATPRRVVVVQ